MPSSKVLLYVAIAISQANNLSAGILYQSGTLGPTGIPRLDVSAQVVLGLNINENVFNGARFQLTEPAKTTNIGGHFVGPFSDESTFFGAIVRLTGENDFPDSSDFSTPDVLGVTLLSFPKSSEEVLGSLPLMLQPGWYAVVFGSGLFGAEGRGAAVRNNIDVDETSYINWQPNTLGDGWSNLDIFPIESIGNLRFVVEGIIIPEPSTIVFMFSGLMAMMSRRFG